MLNLKSETSPLIKLCSFVAQIIWLGMFGLNERWRVANQIIMGLFSKKKKKSKTITMELFSKISSSLFSNMVQRLLINDAGFPSLVPMQPSKNILYDLSAYRTPTGSSTDLPWVVKAILLLVRKFSHLHFHQLTSINILLHYT